MPGVLGRQDTGRQYVPRKPVTVGWEPDLPAIRRGIVLDPFGGTGSTAEGVVRLGRNFIGIEFYENAKIAEDRCRQAYLLRSSVESKGSCAPESPGTVLRASSRGRDFFHREAGFLSQPRLQPAPSDIPSCIPEDERLRYGLSRE
jgi:hypothetical protein